MYIPKINQIKDRKEIFNFVRSNSFGMMVNCQDNLPIVTHIPMELIEKKDGQWIIQCHIAKANPHWKSFEKCSKTLCIFTGLHAYISSSWYNSVNVPTWNYMAVHLYGMARVLDTSKLKKLLELQIDTYEVNSENPVNIMDYESGLIDEMLNAVVGIEILIDDIQAKYKLSQNKSEQDFENVIRHLEKSEHQVDKNLAKVMKSLKKV
jgi:transcriptional regulator